MQVTRAEIVQILKERGEASVDELAEALSLASITIRHHLAVLEKDGLVTNYRERGAVGRPRYVYKLTDEAKELFPKKYHLLADRLLAELKSVASDEELSAIFKRIAEGMTTEYATRLDGMTLEERLSTLVDLLGQEGFLAHWERVEGEYTLKEYNCPYYYVGQRHPEVCHLDLQMISNVLRVQVERKSCVIEGADFCIYQITPYVSISDSNTIQGKVDVGRIFNGPHSERG